MEKYKPESTVSRYYSILFSLPKDRTIAVTYLFVEILYVIAYISTRSISLLVSILYSVLLLITLLFYSNIARSVFKRIRRSIGLALIIQIISSLAGLIDPIIGIILGESLAVLAILGIDGTSIPRYLVPLIPGVIIVCILYTCSFIYMLILLIPIILDYVNYVIMSMDKINGIRSPDLGSLFLQNFLEKTLEIEKYFLKLSEPRIVKPRLLKTCSSALIYTDIHYGPFSNVGSSEFPSMIRRLAGKIGNDVIILHGAGSHDRNIPVRELARDYALTIIKQLASREDWVSLRYSGWLRVRGGDGWDLVIHRFDKLLLILVSRDKGIDDLPYTLQEYIETKTSEYGVDAILIDCHNHEKRGEMDIESLKTLLDESVTRLLVTDAKYTSPKIRSITLNARAPGLIGNELILLEISDGSNPFYIVYMPGNNMVPGGRYRIKEYLSRKTGLSPDNFEVLTNDEHRETGIRAGEPYLPVHVTDELLETIGKGFEILVGNHYCEELYYKKFEYKTRLMNHYAWELLDSLKRGFVKNTVLIISYLVLAPLVSWIIINLLR